MYASHCERNMYRWQSTPVVSFEPLAPVMNKTFCCCASLPIAITSELATPPVIMIALFCGNLPGDLLAEEALFAAQARNVRHDAGSVVEVVQRQQIAAAQVLAVGSIRTG